MSSLTNLDRLFLIKDNLRAVANSMREYSIVECMADADRIIALEHQIARMSEILEEMKRGK